MEPSKSIVNVHTFVILIHYAFLNRGGISIEYANKLKSYTSKRGAKLADKLNSRSGYSLN